MKTADTHRQHATYRIILQAMSHPGKSYRLPAPTAADIKHAPLLAMLGCLLDSEVTFSIIGDDCSPLANELTLYTGSSRTGISEADFIIARHGATDGLLPLIKRGSLEYPDKGATVVYRIDEIMDYGGTAALTGPGINGVIRPRFAGLAAEELPGFREINAEYPLGVDVMFLDSHGRIACIPRSTKIGVA
jgi:alpha-D-ribose 1-methylphosphonate 5-triphosphate synthase subunit PhnH